MQSEDFKWFISHYLELYEAYGDTFLAIKDRKILGVYSSYADAVKETQKTEELGSFIVQKSCKDPSGFTNYIASFCCIAGSEG